MYIFVWCPSWIQTQNFNASFLCQCCVQNRVICHYFSWTDDMMSYQLMNQVHTDYWNWCLSWLQMKNHPSSHKNNIKTLKNVNTIIFGLSVIANKNKHTYVWKPFHRWFYIMICFVCISVHRHCWNWWVFDLHLHSLPNPQQISTPCYMVLMLVSGLKFVRHLCKCPGDMIISTPNPMVASLHEMWR